MGSGAKCAGWRSVPGWQCRKHGRKNADGSADKHANSSADKHNDGSAHEQHNAATNGINDTVSDAGIELDKIADAGQQHTAFHGKS
jgi:hypothetical protein